MADHTQIAPRLTACKDDSSASKSYPINLALLQAFFNNSALAKIAPNTLYPEPMGFSIPHLQIAEDKFTEELRTDARLDADLKHISRKMKHIKYHQQIILVTEQLHTYDSSQLGSKNVVYSDTIMNTVRWE